jgi:hypothetical protein
MKNGIVRLSLLLICCFCTGITAAYGAGDAEGGNTGLVPQGGDYLGTSFDDNEFFWASVTVKDRSGNFVTGLEPEDFTLKTYLTDPAGDPATEIYEIGIDPDKENKWELTHFWEESLGDEKIDLVFLIEKRGTMKEAMPAIRNQADKLVERLLENRIDFRVGGVSFGTEPFITHSDTLTFCGPGEPDNLREGMDRVFSTAGTSWNPVASYDALLWIPWLGFREDARKIVIAVSDILPQTVYDRSWYSVNCSAATRSAVEIFLERHPDLEVYYCLNPETPNALGQYVDRSINPMAADALDKNGLGSGWGALESRGYVTGLRPAGKNHPWPFDQSLIALPECEVEDSRYYFVWETAFPWEIWREFERHPERFGTVRVVIEAAVPGTGEVIRTFIDYPLTKEKTSIKFRYFSEQGAEFPEGWVASRLNYIIGRRRFSYTPYLRFENGFYGGDIIPGSYRLITENRSRRNFAYNSLRVIDRRRVTVPSEGLSMDLTVPTAEGEMFFALARGLLQDLDENWRGPGDPFREFAAEAEGWLDELEEEGLDFAAAVKLKRFTVALSGYTNMSEFAQIEMEKASGNVQEIVEGIADVVAEVADMKESTEFDWMHALGIIMEIGYDIVTEGEFTAQKTILEEGLDRLITYARGKMIEDLKGIVCEKLQGEEHSSLMCSLVNVAVDLPKAVEKEDWSAVVEPLQKLAFDIALDQAMSLVARGFVDTVFAGVEPADQLEADLTTFVKRMLTAVVRDRGFDNFDKTVEQFVQDVVRHAGEAHYARNRETYAAAVKGVFRAVKDEADDVLAGMEGAGFVRDFFIGMAEDMALAALPRVKKNGGLDYKVDGDAVVDVLIEHTLYHVFLKNYFIDDTNKSLRQVLHQARVFEPEEEGYRKWEHAMLHDGFMDYRRSVGKLQNVAWDALRTQKDIENWARGLGELVTILKPIGAALEFMSKLYPPLLDTAEEVRDFVTVLDAFQIIPRSIELALRIDSLETFGNRAGKLSGLAFTGDE